MNAVLRAPWIRAGAAATLLLSSGVLIGSYLGTGPRGRADVPERAIVPAAAARRSVEPNAPSGPPPNVPTPELPEPRIPSAPGFEPFEAGAPRPEFGGQYAVLRGANTVDGAPLPPAAAVRATPPGPAPRVPAQTSSDSVQSQLAVPDPAPAVPPRFRPAPAQGIPRGLALRQPLLAIVRPSGRTVFHDLGAGGGPTPAGLEGDWSVINHCEWHARVDLAMPPREIGDLRAVGRVEGTARWSGEPVVPSQACASAGERFTGAAEATGAQREMYGAAGASLGFAASELRQVADLRGAALLVFVGPAGSALVVADRTGAGPKVLWTYAVDPGDGDLSLVGVYRTGADVQAWLVLGPRSSPRAVVVLSSSNLRSWSRRGPFLLNQP